MKETKHMKKINVLWTGGLDSTYTMMLFSRLPVEIQPYYLENARRSERYELRAMKRLKRDIERHPKTKAKINKIKVVHESQIPKNDKVTAAYRRLKAKNGIGPQYDWIARFVRGSGIKDFYYSAVKPTSSHSLAKKCVDDNGAIKKVKDPLGFTYFVIDKKKSSADLIATFGAFRYPLSWDRTKLEEIAEIRRMGFGKSLKKIWFCHTPIFGHSCGFCHPCQTEIESGLEDFFTSAALRRYKNHRAGMSDRKNRLIGYMDVLLGKG